MQLFFIRSLIFLLLCFILINYFFLPPNPYVTNTEFFDGKKFSNYVVKDPPSITDKINFLLKPTPNQPSFHPYMPIRSQQLKPPKEHVKLSFINHSSWLIQYPKLTILIDPIFSNRVSPLAFMGAKRLHSLPLDIEDLPTINILFISHNHYDHLDKESVKIIINRDNPICVSGIGTEHLLSKWGCKKAFSLNWFETYPYADNILLTFTPAHHTSGRWFFDNDMALWGGLIVNYQNKHTLYYAGDSAYSFIFEFIHQDFPSIDLSILPIGAQESESIHNHIKMNSFQAVEAHKILKSKQSLATNWGTFQFTKAPIFQAIQDLKTAKETHHISDESFIHLIPGQQFLSPFKY